jgi:hypothetical protein
LVEIVNGRTILTGELVKVQSTVVKWFNAEQTGLLTLNCDGKEIVRLLLLVIVYGVEKVMV